MIAILLQTSIEQTFHAANVCETFKYTVYCKFADVDHSRGYRHTIVKVQPRDPEFLRVYRLEGHWRQKESSYTHAGVFLYVCNEQQHL